MPEDVALLAWMGVDAYRFSIAWPRVMPYGRGEPNEKGLDFYDRLVDALLEKGIAPCATLYHWDLPDELEGGWLNRDTTAAFGEYADLLGRRLGDRVALWLTHNEPWCMAFLGYETGLFAPGHRNLRRGSALRASPPRVARPRRPGAPGERADAHRRRAELHARPPRDPELGGRRRRAQARRLHQSLVRRPVFGRGYPSDMLEHYGKHMPSFPTPISRSSRSPSTCSASTTTSAGLPRTTPPRACSRLRDRQRTNSPRTLDREIYPQGLGEMLRRLHADYQPKSMVITENGAAFSDPVAPDGRVHDTERVDFLRAHLEEVVKARAAGLPVDGYFAWSLMDNFEWSEGYTLRYGIVHVDFETQQRTPKDSAHFLRSLSRKTFPLEG